MAERRRGISPRIDRYDLNERVHDPLRSRQRSDSRTSSVSSERNRTERSRSRERDNCRSRSFDPERSLNVRPLSKEVIEAIDDLALKLESGVTNGSRDAFELFVSSVPAITKVRTLIRFINSAMQQIGLVGPTDEPAISCRIKDKYCFVEFRSSLECSKALSLHGIPYLDSTLRVGRPAFYNGPKLPTLTWQELTKDNDNESLSTPGDRSLYLRQPQEFQRVEKVENLSRYKPPSFDAYHHQQSQLISSFSSPELPLPITLSYREIFIGNTNEDMSESTMRDFIGGAMQKMGMSHSGKANPVVHIKLSGKFAFMEMRTCIDAANVLNLNELPFMGFRLHITRPMKYDGFRDENGSREAYFKWDALYQRWLSGELKLMTAGRATRVLMITNMASAADLADTNLYLDIIEDTRLECSQYGIVRSVIVPRHSSSTTAAASGGGGVGNVYVEMNSIDEAKAALVALKGRTFDGRTVDVKFYPEEYFHSMNYQYCFPGIIITANRGPVQKDAIFSNIALDRIDKEGV